MQVFVVALFADVYFTRNKPENPRRDRVFGVVLAIVLPPVVIWSHLATLR